MSANTHMIGAWEHLGNNLIVMVCLAIADHGLLKPYVCARIGKVSSQNVTRWFFMCAPRPAPARERAARPPAWQPAHQSSSRPLLPAATPSPTSSLCSPRRTR